LVVVQWPSTAALQLNGDIPSKVSSLLAPRLTLPVQPPAASVGFAGGRLRATWQFPAAAHLLTGQGLRARAYGPGLTGQGLRARENCMVLEHVEKAEEADEAARDGKVRALVAPLRSKVLG